MGQVYEAHSYEDGGYVLVYVDGRHTVDVVHVLNDRTELRP